MFVLFKNYAMSIGTRRSGQETMGKTMTEEEGEEDEEDEDEDEPQAIIY